MVPFELTDYLSIHRLLYWRHSLWRSQYDSLERQKNLQWKLLSRMLDHCFQNVPYYRERLQKSGLRRENFKSLEDLSKIPVINKKNLLENLEYFKADRFEKYKTRPVRTTGTTGSPLQVYWDRNSNILELLCNWRHFSWFNYRLGMPFLDIRDYHDHLQSKWRWNWKCRALETSIYFWNNSNLDEFADLLKRYKIQFWRGHPNSISQLCRCFDQTGIPAPKPKFISTIGENLLDHERRFIEKWVGNSIADSYGLSEHTALICQCPSGSYHIASEYGIVEILKEDGTSAKCGEEGKIISTGLHNLAFPLLRYDTGDYAIPSNDVCICGRTLPVIYELTGRIEDRVLDKHGRWISCLERSLKTIDGIASAQIVQNLPGE
ncbi:phenylacetate--CoA ligase family protein, partial [bacterium]